MMSVSVLSPSFPASTSIFFDSRKWVYKGCSLSFRPRLLFLKKMACASNDWCQDEVKVHNWEEMRSELALKTRGFDYAVNKWTKWLVCVLYTALVVWKHDAEALWTAMGSVINSWLSITLKYLLKQERPVPALKSSPGMPSSHAQSIFFAVVFVLISTFQKFGVNAPTVIVAVLLVAAGSYLSWLRVTLQLHTNEQVAVGVVLGSAFSIVWYLLWQFIVFRAFVSSSWVRLVVVLTSASSCLGFFIYIVKSWQKNDGDAAY